jgi:hypothetical protein
VFGALPLEARMSNFEDYRNHTLGGLVELYEGEARLRDQIAQECKALREELEWYKRVVRDLVSPLVLAEYFREVEMRRGLK